MNVSSNYSPPEARYLNMAQHALISALYRLLRPLVRILLRNGVSVDAFEEVARRVYVDVAEKDFGIKGKKQTTSRIGVLTGLNRKEVARLLKEPISEDEPRPLPHNRAERVLTGWLRDEDFLDRKGDPLILPFSGAKSFSKLAKRYSGDMPARAIADELIRVGVLEESPDGQLQMISRGYVPDAKSDELVGYLGEQGADWLEVFDHNMTHDRSEARFQRQVIYSHIPVGEVEAFRKLSARWGQRVLEELDRWLAERKSASPEDEPTVRLGLGIYEVESWPSEPGKD